MRENAAKLLIFLATLLAATTVFGRTWAKVPVELQAAQVCWLESEWSAPDCAAVLGVLRRRAGGNAVAFAQQLQAYSAIKSDTPRAARARSLTTDGAQFAPSERQQWLSLQLTVLEVLAGALQSPCPLASHWGAPDIANDVERALRAVAAGQWRVARCSVQTANIFYEINATADPARVASRLRLLQARVRRSSLAATVASGSYPDRTPMGLGAPSAAKRAAASSVHP